MVGLNHHYIRGAEGRCYWNCGFDRADHPLMIDLPATPRRTRFRDLTGFRFGNLQVIRQERVRKGCSPWLCRCDCGQEVAVLASRLKEGQAQSCGCYKEQL
jgi:hypothetical protein